MSEKRERLGEYEYQEQPSQFALWCRENPKLVALCFCVLVIGVCGWGIAEAFHMWD